MTKQHITTTTEPISRELIDGNISDPIMIDSKDLIDGIEAKDLIKLLSNANITLPEVLMESARIADGKIPCKAFYYTTSGPILIMFELTFRDREGKTGLIKTLTGVKALSELFDVQGAFVRVFRCPQESFTALRQYCARLLA